MSAFDSKFRVKGCEDPESYKQGLLESCKSYDLHCKGTIPLLTLVALAKKHHINMGDIIDSKQRFKPYL